MPKYSKLNPIKLGLSLGILTAICIALTTLLGILGLFNSYTALSFEWLTAIYGFIGFKGPDFLSLILGSIYGFLDAFVGGWIFAWVYNKFL